MAAKAGLFAVSAPSPMEDDGEEDYSDDAAPAGDEEEPEDTMAGPFDAYAETVLDAKAPMEDRVSAFREAVLTLIEEQNAAGGGTGGLPPLGGMGGLNG